MATEQIPTGLIADDAVTNAKIGADAVSTTEIANDASISTSGNIATTGSGTLTVAGASTFSGGIANSGTITAGTLSSSVVNNISVIGFSAQLNSDLTTDSAVWQWNTSSNYFANGVTESSGVITFPTAGKYLVTLMCHAAKIGTTSSHFCAARIYIGTTVVSQTAALGYGQTAGLASMRNQGACSGIFDLSANDTIKVDMSESGDCTIFGGSSSIFSAFRIGA